MTTHWKPGDPVPQIHDAVPEMLAEQGLDPEAIRALLDFDVASFQWYRQASKGEFVNAILRRIGRDIDSSHFHGLVAIMRIRCGVGHGPAEPTIGLVAESLALDPSRASRIVADLVARGLVLREASQEDGRKSVLSITDEGRDVMAAVRREKWQVLAQVFEGWSAEEISRFAGAMRNYSDRLQAAIAAMRPPG